MRNGEGDEGEPPLNKQSETASKDNREMHGPGWQLVIQRPANLIVAVVVCSTDPPSTLHE